jgi:hypothetical protein
MPFASRLRQQSSVLRQPAQALQQLDTGLRLNLAVDRIVPPDMQVLPLVPGDADGILIAIPIEGGRQGAEVAFR